MELIRRIILVAATMTTGLVAGLLFGYACTVMPALSRADDRTVVEVMQRVNVAILNGWFLTCFVGALVFGALAIVLHLDPGHRPVLPWAAAATALYLVALGVTAAVNVPLNDQLAAAGDPAAIADLAAVRLRFEDRWVLWNVVRTVAATGAFGCLLGALLASGRSGATR
jgi:uncharacterized membrane protein